MFLFLGLRISWPQKWVGRVKKILQNNYIYRPLVVRKAPTFPPLFYEYYTSLSVATKTACCIGSMAGCVFG